LTTLWLGDSLIAAPDLKLTPEEENNNAIQSITRRPDRSGRQTGAAGACAGAEGRVRSRALCRVHGACGYRAGSGRDVAPYVSILYDTLSKRQKVIAVSAIETSEVAISPSAAPKPATNAPITMEPSERMP